MLAARTLQTVRANGTGSQVSSSLIAAGTTANGTLGARRRIRAITLDPSRIGTSVMVRLTSDGTRIYQITGVSGGGAVRHENLSGVDNYTGLGTSGGAINYTVDTGAGTEEWFLLVEYEPT